MKCFLIMQEQIQIFSQIMNYMTKSSCHNWPVCWMFAYVSESAMYSLSLCNEHYTCFKTSKHDHELKHKCVGKYDNFFKCFEKSEDELTWCFHDRDHKNDIKSWSSLVIVFFNNTLLLLPSRCRCFREPLPR